jgi:hypothetical protein
MTGNSNITIQGNLISSSDNLVNEVIGTTLIKKIQPLTQGENKMAEVDTSLLVNGQAAIRHDIGAAESRVHQNIGDGRRENERGFADTRYNIATESASLHKHVGDMRQEDAENFGHTRRDIQSTSADMRQENAQNFADAKYAGATQAADIRREQAVGFGDTRYNIAERAGDIRREVAGGFDKTSDMIMQEGQAGIMATKDAASAILTNVMPGQTNIKDMLSMQANTDTDRIVDRIAENRVETAERFFTLGRDLAGLTQGQATLSKDIELNSLKGMLEAQKNTQFLSDKIAMDGDKTRGLINDLKYHDLNRGLVERNTELVNCHQDRRHYRDRWDDARFGQIQSGFQGQWAQLQSQIQAFQSQLQETRQGLVNFGTMDRGAGTQSSTSNNVR